MNTFAPKITHRIAAFNYTPCLEDTIADQLGKAIAEEIDNNMLIEMLSNWPKTAYDNFGTIQLPLGWAGELAYPNRTNFEDHMEMYKDMVRHINTVVKNPKQNVLWNKIGDCVYVMFRKQKDMDWFVLKYGA